MADSHSHGEKHSHGGHDIWTHMTPEMRVELRQDDRTAWKHVVGLLLFIVSVGIVLAVLTVILSA